MTRHGKNCTASAFYSYAERQRDAKASGYGTLHARLGADSIKEFDCCSLTLQPCKQPVITPDGYLFDREAILEYIVAQRKLIAKKTKEWEKQNEKEEELKKKAEEQERADLLKKFKTFEGTPAHKTLNEEKKLKRHAEGGFASEPAEKVKATGNEVASSNMHGEKSKKLTSFWIPELNPTAEPSKIEKPSQKVLCPVSNKPLKLKELLEVKFTPMPDDGAKSIYSKKVRCMCPVTYDALTNTTRCAYLKTSKVVVKWDVVEKLIKSEDTWVDPINGETESDIIELKRGGTGYAATNEVKAKLLRPQLELQ
ncbi:unnamed protein product, partial [Mesorhabditis belari]|uniref:Nitric oxide synthase-interacting protein homolog n=1 Tax=Mesorhabditis belari TaxID=2138241 RepID=A0AAF3EB31_9BILA